MPRPKVLIEQWLPIDQIGAESMRDASAAKRPPLNRLHIWWARRPLTTSRAAILASLLPAYPTSDDANGPPWPKSLLDRFPTFEAYKEWFLALLGIFGNPAKSRKIIEWAATNKLKLTPQIITSLPKSWKEGLPNDMGISIPYGYQRAFTYNASHEQLDMLYDLLEWTWGTREITFCDPMSGGGSIPFEALRYGLTVYANELNSVASVVLRATLDYPARFGASLAADIRKYGKLWCDEVRDCLLSCYPLEEGEQIVAYLWARTVACPTTGKTVPLSPNWWLAKGADPWAVQLITNKKYDRCHFEVVSGTRHCRDAKPDLGTIKQGTGLSPWTGEAIDGDYIKAEAQAGRMGEQLFAIASKKRGSLFFRAPTDADEAAAAGASRQLYSTSGRKSVSHFIPDEPRKAGRADWACEIYGAKCWSDTYTPRQLLAMTTMVACLNDIATKAKEEIGDKRAEAVRVYIALAIDKAADYNSRQVAWHISRQVVGHAFTRHDLSMRWSFAELDGARNVAPWVVQQVSGVCAELAELAAPSHKVLQEINSRPAFERLHFTSGNAQSLKEISPRAVRCITVDPPYYDNVNYAECSNYFYIWMKRTLGTTFPELFSAELANADDEAVMNVARFKDTGRNAKSLAIADYENKMLSCFSEMHRILADDGVLTVMFTHKQVEAWDTLGSSLIRAGFQIDASWPVHTEPESSLHQAKKNAAASTILLVCRKRLEQKESVWWDDLKAQVRQVARQKAAEFDRQGIKGVDLYISTFGPALSIISENWPVLTSETDPKTGDPLPLKPGEALDLAREEVINLRKQGLLLGRSVEFDPITDWYLMAWDAFRAQEFPADESRKLALALGLDLERDIIREKKLVSKKSGTVVLCKPADRRKKNMVDPDAESFPHLIDALHTAMLIYDEEGSKACQVFVDRQGLRTDSRVKALAQAMMQAIPTTRGKDGKFLRPEMTTLDALRALFWDDIPAPKEEEPPKIHLQGTLFNQEVEVDEEEEEIEDETDEEDEG